MTETDTASRRYGGRDKASRSAERRAALLAAGLELFGTIGYPASSVKKICDRAGLTERYFYESFTHREALLSAVYDSQIEQVRTATLTALADAEPELAPQAHAAVEAFVRTVAADPRRARVIFVEVVGVSSALEVHRRAVMREFAQLIVGFAGAYFHIPATGRLDVSAMLFAGGMTELMVDWTLADAPQPLDELIDVAAAILINGFGTLDRLPGEQR
ncbi:TetR/AcrR family transcriptional regulator [Nocardia sp. NPDC058633]|uniref:TetR/AcrR family transcriptional regulator n=1 Tax=Nocardia sp. NPDC058633 TaxID=3346568 RepID=UPI00365AE90B